MSRDLILVALALMSWGVGEGMFLSFQPLYLQELGASPVEIGGILGLIGLAMTIAHLPAGYLADRFGRRPLLRTAWVMGVTATWIMALSPSLPWFVLGSALYGLTAFVIAPLNSYVTAARGQLGVGRVITFVSAIYNIGAILGPLLGGWIGYQMGLRSTFLIAACIFIFSTVIIFQLRPQPVEARLSNATHNGLGELLNRRYITYLVIIFIAVFSMYLPQPLSQNFLQNERILNLSQIGQLISTRSLGIVVLNLILGAIDVRAGFLLAQLGVSGFTILLWQGTGFPWYLGGYFLLGSYGTARSLASAQGRTLANAANMGLAYGMIETVMALSAILAPPLAGWLYDLDPIRVYPISLVLILMAIVITFFFSPIKAKDMEEK